MRLCNWRQVFLTRFMVITGVCKPVYYRQELLLVLFFGYKTAGIYQSTADIQNNASYSGARVGGLRYQDINGDGVIDPKDRTIIGDPNPDFTYGLNLNASYQNFDIAAFFYGVQGNDIF